MRIPVAGPWITDREIEYVKEAVSTAWYDKANVFHQRFETAFAEYLGLDYAMALPSCTSAIHLALLALGVGPGDEVIVPDATWIASTAPVTYVGATPIFADIDEMTWCLSPDSFRGNLSSRTKAVIPVDLYGGIPDMDAIRPIAQERGIAIVEDAAEAVGSEYKGQKAGALGDVGVFSFHGSKILTTGEGGMLVTNRKDLFERAAVLRDHGRRPGDKMFWNHEVAYKYKMSSMQAALGLAQLERLNEIVARKRQIFSWYQEEFENTERVRLNAEPSGTKNNYWMVTIVWPQDLRLDKADVIAQLSELGIDSRPFFHPLSSIPAYSTTSEAKKASLRNSVSYSIGRRAINLPSALNLSREQVAQVGAAVRKILQAARA